MSLDVSIKLTLVEPPRFSLLVNILLSVVIGYPKSLSYKNRS